MRKMITIILFIAWTRLFAYNVVQGEILMILNIDVNDSLYEDFVMSYSQYELRKQN